MRVERPADALHRAGLIGAGMVRADADLDWTVPHRRCGSQRRVIGVVDVPPRVDCGGLAGDAGREPRRTRYAGVARARLRTATNGL